MTKPSQKKEQIELHPDAWARFEQFIKQVAKAGPQHRVAKKTKAKKKPSKTQG